MEKCTITQVELLSQPEYTYTKISFPPKPPVIITLFLLLEATDCKDLDGECQSDSSNGCKRVNKEACGKGCVCCLSRLSLTLSLIFRTLTSRVFEI